MLEKLSGRYIAAKDMNISSEDLEQVKKKSRHVLGIVGEPGSSGDPSPVTAIGVLRALEATVEEISGTKKLAGVKIAIQGIGHVGYRLAELAHERGAELWVSDIDEAALKRAQKELNAKIVANDAILDVACDIFSPNARGAVFNEQSIARLKCKAIVGAANNQLGTPNDGFRLHEKGILYAPDYAVNSGGIINIFVEYENKGYVEAKALKKADEIYDTMREIFRRSRAQKTAPFVLADRLAEERLYGRSSA
jgi:leucine dehydrogenase